MSREIKFRAWDGVLDKYVYWKDLLLDNVFISILYDKNYDIEQYTGLKDTKGIEIYEGDIVKIQYVDEMDENDNLTEDADISIVKEKGIVDADFGDYNTTLIEWAMDSDHHFEIIGNIHQHPELLEVLK